MGLWLGRFGLIEGSGMVLGPLAGILRRGLHAVDRLGRFGAGGGHAGEDEIAGRSVVRRAYEEIVEVEAGEQLGKHDPGLAGSIGAEDAVLAGNADDFHSGFGGDDLQDLEQLRVAGVDGELAVLKRDRGGYGRPVGRCGGSFWSLRRRGFLRDGRGGFGGLRREEWKREKNRRCGEYATWKQVGAAVCRMNGHEFAGVLHDCAVECGRWPLSVY